MHFHNSVLHYLFTMEDGFVIFDKARAFKAEATNSRPRPNINIRVISENALIWDNKRCVSISTQFLLRMCVGLYAVRIYTRLKKANFGDNFSKT